MADESKQIDPQEVIPIESIIAVMMGVAVTAWEQGEPAPPPDRLRSARVPALLEVTTVLTGQSTDDFERALASGDARAYGALSHLEKAAESAASGLRERCLRWSRGGQWSALRHEAEVFGYIAAALGYGGWLCESWMLQASACRAIGDDKGTIAGYRTAINIAGQFGLTAALPVAYDNLGNVLADAGALDEALACYEQALEHERDPAGRVTILSNRAGTYARLGELHAAHRVLTEVAAELERSGIRGNDLGINLDNLALSAMRLGEPESALHMLERAEQVFPPDELTHRAVNLLSQAQVREALGDAAGQEAAFMSAYELAVRQVKRDHSVEHYRQGYAAARQRALPYEDQAHRLFTQAVAAKQAEQWGTAVESFLEAAQLARSRGDEALALRAEANVAAILADAGQSGQALELAREVRHRASRAGLAKPEGMVVGTLVGLADLGADLGDALGALGLIVTAKVLHDIHVTVVTGSKAGVAEVAFETQDGGGLDLELGKVAESYGADRLAATCYRAAVEKARHHGLRFELVNRLAGLTHVLLNLDDKPGAEQAISELTVLLEAGDLPLRAEIVGRRAIAAQLADGDPEAAISQLRSAVTASEQLRQRVAPGPGRASVTVQTRGIYYRLAELLHTAGGDAEGFSTLQGVKARRILDAREGAQGVADARGSVATLDMSATLPAVQQRLAELNQDRPSVLVDLVAAHDGITAYVITADGIQVFRSLGDPGMLRRGGAADVQEREIHMVQTCQRDPMLRKLAEGIAAVVPAGSRVLLIPDGYLHNVPLHLATINGRPWCESMSIGYLPAAAMLCGQVGSHSRTTMSFVAGDSKGDLPGARAECRNVAALLGTEPLVGPQCTFAALRDYLQGDLEVVHLAVHGRSDVRRGGRASLMFADGDGGVEWVPLSALAALPWRAQLIVLSGCGTGVGGFQIDGELMGVAQAAAEAGASRVLATLWPVDDQITGRFMDIFYRQLMHHADEAVTDLLAIVDTARSVIRTESTIARPPARRDGRDVLIVSEKGLNVSVQGPTPDNPADSVQSWGPFAFFGDPELPQISASQQ